MHDHANEKTIVYLVGGIICMAAVLPGPAWAASKRKAVAEGNVLYQQGAYSDSAEKYRAALENDPESDIINFNLGTALYKGEDYPGAVSHLRKTLLSDDTELREKGFYNLGNALYRLGLTKEKDDVGVAISSLEEALKQYEGALAIRKDDADAQNNYEFVKKELERLRRQEEKKKEQQKKEQEKSGEGQKKDQKDKDQQSQEGSQKSEQQQQSGESRSPEGAKEQQQEQKGSQQQQSPASEDHQKEESPGTPKAQEGQSEPSERKPAQGQAPADARELTQKEAQTLLEGYQQNEEPQGLLDMYPRKGAAAPVLKDW